MSVIHGTNDGENSGCVLNDVINTLPILNDPDAAIAHRLSLPATCI